MQEDNLKGNYAGFVSRLIAFGVDVAVIAVTLVVITWLVNTVLQLFGLEDFSAMETISKILLSGLFGLLYSAGYFIFFWALASQTPGKTLMGLRIVTTEGQAISFGQAIRRMFGYIVSIMAFFIGFLWILVDNRRQGWQDKIAGTFVVYSWDARVGGYLGSWHQAQIDKEDQAK